MSKYKDQVAENPIFQTTKDKLDSVGCGMCLAKWTQVTLQLQVGHNHSCHHPKTHPISQTEIQQNPSALHNTQFKKEKRKEMLDGKRPEECDYCWNVEDNSDRFSDRIFKSNETWSKPHFDEIVNSDWRGDFNPRYVEVAFSNACSFKCSYCGPTFSSTWTEEVNKYGGYPTTDNFNDIGGLNREGKWPIPHREENPYVEAFWKWWPDLYRDLHTFRITGGEPLLSIDTWNILDYVIEHKNPNTELQLAINSNLGVPDELIDRFIEKVQKIEDEERVREFIVFTSVDTWGEQAEYIRNGLNFNRFWDNLNKLLEKCNKVNLTIMSTYNALSVSNYERLLHGIYDLKTTYGSADRYWESAVFLDSSYLRYPEHQTVQVLPNDFAGLIYRQTQLAEYMATPNFETRLIGYSDIEVQKLKRIYDWHISRDESDMTEQRKNFYTFFSEHDKRRGTNFCKTFPELEDFYYQCNSLL
jgi:organic radical activating enzyme